MLTTDKTKPLIANEDIKCFKVMISWNNGFYNCPPAFQHYLNHWIDLPEYHLNELYQTASIDSEKDYRKDWVIWEGFYHTFCDLKSAEDFVNFLNNKIQYPENSKHPELYKIPNGAKIVILNAIIPTWALYYEWEYKRKDSNEKTFASNKVIYTNIYEW